MPVFVGMRHVEWFNPPQAETEMQDEERRKNGDEECIFFAADLERPHRMKFGSISATATFRNALLAQGKLLFSFLDL